MPVTLEQSEDSSVIRLEGSIDIASAAELKKLFIQAFASGHEVRVELDGATDLDVTAVQLLWAARREAKVMGVEIALTGQAPEQVGSSLRQAGFQELVATMNGSQVSGVDSCQQ
jgi:anti-anti-sigma factor